MNAKFSGDFKLVFWLAVFLGILVRTAHPAQSQFAFAQVPGEVRPVSAIDGSTLGNGPSTQPSISSDGRFIAYISQADNLVPHNPSGGYGIFVHDLMKSETYRLPVLMTSSDSTITPTTAKISADGRFVVFSTATGISSSPQNQPSRSYGVFVHDLFSGETQPVSVVPRLTRYPDSPPLPTLSTDGRFTAIAAFDSSGELAGGDILIYDRVREHNYGTSIPGDAVDTSDHPPVVIISDDGRFVIYHTDSYPGRLGIFNRVTAENNFHDYTDHPEAGSVVSFDISSAGNSLAFVYQQTVGDGEVIQEVYLYNPAENDLTLFTTLRPGTPDQTTLAISGDGSHLAIRLPAKEGGQELYRYVFKTGFSTLVDAGSIGPVLDLSHGGESLVYTRDINGVSQVLVWEERGLTDPTYIQAGRVIDPAGHPLALVTIQDNYGHVVRTDGDGRFWLNDIPFGKITLTPFKEGFLFNPPNLQANVDSDNKDLEFVYAHHETLLEAKKDLGMPYSFDRGSSGPFHGYSAGYCTDLILDAFTWGVDFNIQFALEQDFRDQPWHFYRWRDARNAHDMWRYFSYTGQLQPHENPYQPGDIVFFDWSEDGEIDHVALVSEVNSRNRPRRMYDASGVINANPRGLAAELPWEDFHEKTVRGFARWSGKYEPVIVDLPPGQMLQTALSGSRLEILLLDPGGNILSSGIYGIPGGRFNNWTWEKTISLEDEFSPQDFYLVVVYNPTASSLPYRFTAQFLEAGLVNGRFETAGNLLPGEIKRFPVTLNLDERGTLTLGPGITYHRIEGRLSRNR